ncbi:MAG TPA: TetR/AcrR family transcriptional regulator [Actinomycetota bacterium]|nr:TetR/AcrR family transcriptional regulator [Actinomycetota bacterium]
MADGDRKSGRSARADQIVATARLLLEREGPEALTMRRLGEELGIRAPSLYKHLASKKAIEVALIEEAFRDIGAALHAALEGRDDPVDATRNLLATYRRFSLAQPNLYRLATAGRLPREDLAPGLEDWAGEPFLLVTGEPHLAQALWSFAHGMVILEIDGRYPREARDSELDRTWEAGAAAFAGLVSRGRPGGPRSPARSPEWDPG